MKVAALDLGSNTFLLLICEVESGRITKIYQDEIRVTKLGQGVHANKKFHPEALVRAEDCLKEYAELIHYERPQKIMAVATSAARDVTNSEELFRIGDKYGIPIQIIPGQLEAQITFVGATYDLEDSSGIGVIDVGGGSTEVIALNSNGETTGESVDVGSVRLTEMFVTQNPIPQEELLSLKEYARIKFKEAQSKLPSGKLNTIIGVAGTPTTLAAVMQGQPYKDDLVHGYKISAEDIEHWIQKLSQLKLEERKAIVGMDPQRADVIVAGMCVLQAALNALKAKELIVSIRGVRYGVAIHAANL